MLKTLWLRLTYRIDDRLNFCGNEADRIYDRLNARQISEGEALTLLNRLVYDSDFELGRRYGLI